MATLAPGSGKNLDLKNQLMDLNKKLRDPSLSRAQKELLYDQRLRVENKLRSINPNFDAQNSNIDSGLIDQINEADGFSDQDVPIGVPVDQYLEDREKQPPEKKEPVDPEKYKNQGGPAPQADKKKSYWDRFRRKKDEAKEDLKDQAKSQAVDAGKKVGKKLLDQAMAGLKKQVVQIGAKIAASLAAHPWVWIIVAAIIIVLLIIVIFWGISMNAGNQMPNANGTTFVQAADPLKDKELILKTLRLSGDQLSRLDQTFLEDLKKQVLSIKEEMPDNNAVVTQIDEIVRRINELIPLQDPIIKKDKGKELQDKIVVLINNFYDVGVINGVVTKYIFDPGLVNSQLFNKNPHIGTPLYRTKNGEHACVKIPNHPARTYIQFCNDTCDAVDIKIGTGKKVYAAFGGTVTHDGDGFRILLQKGGNTYEATYAHMTDKKFKKGDTVNVGDFIGLTGEGHLHFELAVNNKCVRNSSLDLMKANSEDKLLGFFLWEKILKTLNLSQQ